MSVREMLVKLLGEPDVVVSDSVCRWREGVTWWMSTSFGESVDIRANAGGVSRGTIQLESYVTAIDERDLRDAMRLCGIETKEKKWL